MDTVFITLGVGFSNIAMAEKIACHIDDGESCVKVAKKMRKTFAEHPYYHGWSIDTKPFKPSQFFYAIYENVDSQKPFAYSANTPEKFLNIPVANKVG